MIDYRSRAEADNRLVDFVAFHDQILGPRLRGAHGPLAARGLARLGLPPLAIEVDGRAFTYAPRNGTVEIIAGRTDDAVVAEMDVQVFSDLVLDLRTTTGTLLAGLVRLPTGQAPSYLQWDLVLRAMLDGRTIHEPGAIALRDRAGQPLDLARGFTRDAAPEDVIQFLDEAGFVIFKGLFTAAEMAEVSAEIDRIAPSYRAGDGVSWWARTESAGQRLVRLKSVQDRSPFIAQLLRDPRYLAIADLWPARYPRHLRTASPIDACIKPIDTVEGVSDMNWHKDCSLGRHSYDCCNFGVGFAVTAADDDHGYLGVIAGSHRTQVPLVRSGGARVELEADLDLPVVPLITEVGDVSVHLSCTLHRAVPPKRYERRVMYSGYVLEEDRRLDFTGDDYAAMHSTTRAHSPKT